MYALASFPGRSHCQYLITPSMKHGRRSPGRSGHIHTVDTRRAVPSEECPVLYCPSKGWMSERCQGRQSIPFVQTDRCKTGFYNGWAPHSVCLPSVYLTSSHVTRPPRPPPTAFHTGSDQILAVGTAWDRGYACMLSIIMRVSESDLPPPPPPPPPPPSPHKTKPAHARSHTPTPPPPPPPPPQCH